MHNPHARVRDEDFQTRVIERLRVLVEHETPSGDLHALAAFASLLEKRWRDISIRMTRHETRGGPVLIGELPGKGWGSALDPVLLVTHSDTVWPAGTLMSRLPWSRDEHGIIRGPGVFDMKSGIVIIEALVGLLTDSTAGHPPLRIFVAPDEETGSAFSTSLLELASVGCSAALGFESPHPDGSLKIGRWGSTRLRLSVQGREAHAALDSERGISAIDELIDQLLIVRTAVSSLTSHDHPVLLNIGAIDAPGKTNVVSGTASAMIGLRFSRKEEEETVMQLMGSLSPVRKGAAITVGIESHRPAWGASELDTQLGTRLLPDAVAGSPSRGAADTNSLAESLLPVVDGLGASGGGAHALTEHILEDSLWHRISTLHGAFTTEHRWLP